MLLPNLQEKLSPRQSRMLGIAWAAVRRIAPTRPHPVVARRPPGNVLSALPLTILDRGRDRVEAMAERGGVAASALSRLDAALAGTSHAVEHLPGMSRGEDPSTRAVLKSGFPWAAAAIGTVAAALAVRAVARRRQ